MKDLKHIRRFNESNENFNISDVRSSKTPEDRLEEYVDNNVATQKLNKPFITPQSLLIQKLEIKQAAKEDYDKQTKYDNAYDRQKGFIEGVKWAMKRLKNYR